MQIINRNIEELIPADYNPRKISPEAMRHLQQSLKAFSAVEPAIINMHPKRKNVIVGGHQRLTAAREMGWETFPCIEVELTKAQERELNIRLNKNTGEWDFKELETHFDVEELVGYGFSLDELSFMMPEEEEEQGEGDGEEKPENECVEVVFKLHIDQKERVERALDLAKLHVEYDQNDDADGNALWYIADKFIMAGGK
jgi:ParB-like chromosome segregation protein Spo0J